MGVYVNYSAISSCASEQDYPHRKYCSRIKKYFLLREKLRALLTTKYLQCFTYSMRNAPKILRAGMKKGQKCLPLILILDGSNPDT